MTNMLRDASLLLLAFSVYGASGCTESPRSSRGDAANPFGCNASTDCNDEIPCTVDTCNAAHICEHAPIDASCTGAGEHCVVGIGCSTTVTCTDPSMCDDGISCTVDTCDVGNVCGHQAVDASCTDPATPVCDLRQGCIAGATVECRTADDCEDGFACTLDSCGVDMMCRHMPIDSMCTGTNERCDVGSGCVAFHGCTTVADCTPAGETWWNFCDGVPSCDPEFGCSNPVPRDCRDTMDCTIDACDRSAGTNGACVYVCDSSRPECGCPTTGPSCAGHFQLSPSPTGSCATVSWDLSDVQITNIDGALTVSPRLLSNPNAGMTTNIAMPSCPSFVATRSISGGCTETYTMQATFTDEDHLVGSFDADFVGACGVRLGLCASAHNHYEFTGVRIP